MALLEQIITDYFTITATDVSNKYVTLTRTPTSPSEVALNVGGTPQIYNTDFYVEAKLLKWDGKAIEPDVAEGDKFRVVYATEGSINVFATTPQRDGVAVTSTINEEALIPLVESDSYFDSINKVFRVDVTYVHSADRQTVTVMHLIPNLTGQASWSTFSRSGTWRKERARLVDKDGAQLYIGRSVIGEDQDLVLS